MTELTFSEVETLWLTFGKEYPVIKYLADEPEPPTPSEDSSEPDSSDSSATDENPKTGENGSRAFLLVFVAAGAVMILRLIHKDCSEAE